MLFATVKRLKSSTEMRFMGMGVCRQWSVCLERSQCLSVWSAGEVQSQRHSSSLKDTCSLITDTHFTVFSSRHTAGLRVTSDL